MIVSHLEAFMLGNLLDGFILPHMIDSRITDETFPNRGKVSLRDVWPIVFTRPYYPSEADEVLNKIGRRSVNVDTLLTWARLRGRGVFRGAQHSDIINLGLGSDSRVSIVALGDCILDARVVREPMVPMLYDDHENIGLQLVPKSSPFSVSTLVLTAPIN